MALLRPSVNGEFVRFGSPASSIHAAASSFVLLPPCGVAKHNAGALPNRTVLGTTFKCFCLCESRNGSRECFVLTLALRASLGYVYTAHSEELLGTAINDSVIPLLRRVTLQTREQMSGNRAACRGESVFRLVLFLALCARFSVPRLTQILRGRPTGTTCTAVIERLIFSNS